MNKFDRFVDKLEQKIGRFAIPNLMLYIVIGSAIVYVLYLANPEFIYYLYLIPSQVLKGQVWRLITFIFIPSSISNPLSLLISLYFYYFIGKILEQRWGSFRFNLYYLIGILSAILASFILNTYGSPDYINESLFLAFATLYPDMQVLLFFIIPIKVKWLGWLTAALLIFQFIFGGSWRLRIYIIISLANYLIFFGPRLVEMIKDFIRRMKYRQQTGGFGNRNNQYSQYNQYNRRPNMNRNFYNRANFRNFRRPGQRSARQNRQSGDTSYQNNQNNTTRVAFHRCQVCGKTELDDPAMQFRYCSQCNGNYEYCMDHLNNHQHIR